MRTTVDLITQLERNAEGFDAAGLLVGFKSSTVCVESNNPRRLDLLQEAIRNG
jgi:hypothetical protein